MRSTTPPVNLKFGELRKASQTAALSFGAESKHGMVATVHPLATDAAVNVLNNGGQG